MSFFGIKDEFEIYSGNFSKLSKEGRNKNSNIELLQRRIMDRIVEL